MHSKASCHALFDHFLRGGFGAGGYGGSYRGIIVFK